MTPALRILFSRLPSQRRLTAAASFAAALIAASAASGAPAGQSGGTDAAPSAPTPAAAATSPVSGDTMTLVGPAGDAASELADTQDKLATALRSYSLLQDENTQLKAAADKGEADRADLARQLDEARATIAALQAQAAAATQVAPLQSQVREARDEAGRLAAEDAALRTRLALQAPAPAADHPSPTRPAQVLPDSESAAPASSGVAPSTAAAAATPPERTYTVREGDSLGKIALKFYGSASQWPKILEANHASVPNEKALAVGTVLAIP